MEDQRREIALWAAASTGQGRLSRTERVHGTMRDQLNVLDTMFKALRQRAAPPPTQTWCSRASRRYNQIT